MSRVWLIPLLTAATIVVAPLTLAQAATNLNSSKSNAFRSTTVKSSKSGTSDRMGGGGGTSKPKSNALNPQP